MMSLCVFLCLFGIDALSAYTLVNRLPLGAGFIDIESVEYDSATQQYLIASFYTSSIHPFPASIVVTASYDETDTSTIVDGGAFPYNTFRDILNSGATFDNEGESGNFTDTFQSFRPAGMAVVGTSLYVVDFLQGQLAEWDTSTQSYEDSIFVEYSAGVAANLDGLCVDTSATNMLYATDFGFGFDADNNPFPSGQQAVYAINTDTGVATRIYDSTVTVEGALADYNIFPNGCVVVDGVLYTVDFSYDSSHTPGFAQYDIASGEWSVEYDILPGIGGDGLVYVDALATFFATDLNLGALMKYTPGEDDAFEVIVTGITTAADMAYNADDKILAIAEFNTGFVSFVAIDEALFSTTADPEDLATTADLTTTSDPEDLATTDQDIDSGDSAFMMAPIEWIFIICLLFAYFM